MIPAHVAARDARDAFWRGLTIGLSIAVLILLTTAAVLL